MNYYKLLVNALKRAFTNKTKPVPLWAMDLPSNSTRKDSVRFGLMMESPLMYALFCERWRVIEKFSPTPGKWLKSSDDLTKEFPATGKLLRTRDEVLVPINDLMWKVIRSKFPELCGQHVELISGLQIWGYPIVPPSGRS